MISGGRYLLDATFGPGETMRLPKALTRRLSSLEYGGTGEPLSRDKLYDACKQLQQGFNGLFEAYLQCPKEHDLAFKVTSREGETKYIDATRYLLNA
ncbi:MAG: hypothetical protein VKJ06_05350 [Vampirovibrionales bacterium]|nr:hypothetical protein [Vampirovibrionales bacterium]